MAIIEQQIATENTVEPSQELSRGLIDLIRHPSTSKDRILEIVNTFEEQALRQFGSHTDLYGNPRIIESIEVKENQKILFLSDLHISGNFTRQRMQVLQNCILQFCQANEISTISLGGDIEDIFTMYGASNQQKIELLMKTGLADFYAELLKFTQTKGGQILKLRGNHDDVLNDSKTIFAKYGLLELGTIGFMHELHLQINGRNFTRATQIHGDEFEAVPHQVFERICREFGRGFQIHPVFWSSAQQIGELLHRYSNLVPEAIRHLAIAENDGMISAISRLKNEGKIASDELVITGHTHTPAFLPESNFANSGALHGQDVLEAAVLLSNSKNLIQLVKISPCGTPLQEA